ncbi:MAG: hypothetical protein WAY02_09375 [Burkholderiaceae bacterium]
MKVSLTPTPQQFRRELTAAQRALKGQLKDASAVAADWASEAMQRRYNNLYQRRSGRASGSFRAVTDRAMFGGARIPYMMGQNFGSARYAQFPSRVAPDHFAFAVVKSGTATIQAMYDAGMSDAMDEVFNG